MKHLFILMALLVSSLIVRAQAFLKHHPEEGNPFLLMQKDFSEWKAIQNNKEKKGWKYFKRWEHEMQMHTNGRGYPVEAKEYLQELKKVSEQKSMMQKNTTSLQWTPSGPYDTPLNNTAYMENGIGRINCIGFDPVNPAVYYAGVAQGGLWKTRDNGQSWIPLTDNLPITRISDVVVDPNNSQILYISLCDFEYIGFGLRLNGRKRHTHYGLGVYKSTNGGASWSPTGLGFQLTDGDDGLIRKIYVNRLNSNKLVACGTSGMYVSNDGGNQWTQTMDSLFWDLVEDPQQPNVLFAATGWVKNANEGNAAIYKSTDYGNTWTILNTGIPPIGLVQRIKLAIAPSNSSRIYALAVDTVSGLYGTYTSADAGNTWQFIPAITNILEWDEGINPGGQGTYDLALVVSPFNDSLIYAGGVNVWASGNAGQTYEPVSHWTLFYGPTIHCDIHYMAFQPQTNNLFVCSDGGGYRTMQALSQPWADASAGTPWPTLWTKLNDNIQVTSFYKLSSSQTMNGKLMAGAQDNATAYFNEFGWSTVFGGDGMDNYIFPDDDNASIASSQYGNFAKSTDNGVFYNQINANISNEPAEWVSPLAGSTAAPGRLYAGFVNVARSDDHGENWVMVSSFPSSSPIQNEISALAVSASDPDVVYAGKRVRYEYGIPGKVYRTLNGGAIWNEVTNGLPDSLYYTSLEIDPNNSSRIFAGMAGMVPACKVFRSNDEGNTWENISYNLPNLPVNALKILPDTGILLAATDVGLYALLPGSSNWSLWSSGLPNVILSDIEINAALNKIYVSTFGRGIWEANLQTLITNNVQAKPETFEGILYPTVSDGHFTVHATEACSMDCIDVMGRLVMSRTLPAGKNSLHIEGNKGMFYLRLRNISGTKEKISTFIIQ
ncbi:MAG: WD40/YVTN/BNR-like repeat-containing protein [Bacteroidota bacterium]